MNYYLNRNVYHCGACNAALVQTLEGVLCPKCQTKININPSAAFSPRLPYEPPTLTRLDVFEIRKRLQKVRTELDEIDTDLTTLPLDNAAPPALVNVVGNVSKLCRILIRVIDSLP